METLNNNSETVKVEDLRRFLLFLVGNKEYGMDLHALREAITMPTVRPIPQSPPHFLGLYDLRGIVIPIIDLRIRFGMKAIYNDDTGVLVCVVGERLIGYVVDHIQSVVAIPAKSIDTRVSDQGGIETRFLSGVFKYENALVLLLDASRILSENELKKL